MTNNQPVNTRIVLVQCLSLEFVL